MRTEGWRRRWPWITAGAVLAIAALAALVWFIWLPEYRPSLRDGERYGIDVSHHQGDIDWSAVAGDNIEFAYIKATEGGDHTDTRFEENWHGAGSAGMDRGAYHFFTLCTPGEAQAEHFLSVLPDDMELAAAVDLELAGNCSARPSPDEVRVELDAFLTIVETATGVDAVLYVGDDWEGMYPTRGLGSRPLWHLRFLRRPNVDGWMVWQVTGFAHVEGISGNVDLDIMRPDPGSIERCRELEPDVTAEQAWDDIYDLQETVAEWFELGCSELLGDD